MGSSGGRSAGSGRAALAVAALTVLAAACTSAWLFHAAPESLAPWVAVDDAYYYLLVAWHRVHDGFASADGIHPTNGVQLLWFWCLVGVSTLADDRASLLADTLRLCAALVVLAVPLAYGAGAALGRRGQGLAFALAILWLGQGAPVLVSGLESALYLVVLLLSVWAYARLLRRPSTPRFVLLAVALSGAVLCRLDAAVWAAVLALHAAVELSVERRRRSLPWRGALASGLAVGLAAVGFQLASFHRMGGSWLPVSLLWKRTWSATGTTPHPDWPTLAPGEALAEAAHRIVEPFTLTGASPRRVALLLAVLVALALALMARDALASLRPVAARSEAPPDTPPEEAPEAVPEASLDSTKARLARARLVLVLAVALHTVIVAVTADRPWVWYFVPAMVVVAFALASLAARLREPGLTARAGRWPWRLAVSLLALLALASAAARWLEVSSRFQGSNLATERIAVARWMRVHLPAGTRVGALNSGELGFFSGLPVTNLDGLANGASYYRYRRDGGTLLGYLRSEGICVYTDYNVPPEIAEHSVVLHRRSLANAAGAPRHRTLQVRRLDGCTGSQGPPG